MKYGRLLIVIAVALVASGGCGSKFLGADPDPIQATDRTFKKGAGASQQTEEFAAGTSTTNSVRITCTADFDVAAIRVQLRDQHGRDIGGPADRITNVSCPGASGLETGNGSASCKAKVAKNSRFTLSVDVDSDNPTWRLYISLSGPQG